MGRGGGRREREKEAIKNKTNFIKINSVFVLITAKSNYVSHKHYVN